MRHIKIIIFLVMVFLCFHVDAEETKAAAKAEITKAIKVYHFTEKGNDIKIFSLIGPDGKRTVTNITITKIDGTAFTNVEMLDAVKYADYNAAYVRSYPSVGLWESPAGITLVTAKEVEHRRYPGRQDLRPVKRVKTE